MGFWPFRWGKDEKDAPSPVEYASSVVAETTSDGALVRAKLTAHFVAPLPPEDARALLAHCERFFRDHVAKQPSYAGLLGEEGPVAEAIGASLTSPDKERLRSLEVLAIHVVGEPPAGARSPEPAQRPHRAGSNPFIAGHEEHRRQSSGQMLAVRSERLIPTLATREMVAGKLAPLLRDEATKLLIAVLRAYDLLVVRDLSPADAEAAAEALVPTSAAPLGHFAESRAEELYRWEAALGDDALRKLRDEVAVTVTYLLQAALSEAGVDLAIATDLLGKVTEKAFSTEAAPLPQLGRYLVDHRAAFELASVVRNVVPDARLDRVEGMVAPVLASLREDLLLVAEQIKSSVIKG